ncbi:MAG: AIR synthase family protein [Anaerolineales bacterium]
MTSKYHVGKVPAADLGRLLEQITSSDPSVVVGPGIGLDAAVMDMGDRYLVAKTDPITFATDQLGWYAVHVNANDVACMGATPRWFLATLLMPEGQADEQLATTVFEQITQACAALGVSLVGGHTEATYGIDRPLILGCMLGEVDPDELVTPAGIKEGDIVILAGGVPIEATAIIAREKAEELEGQFDADFLSRCANYLHEPGISVLPAAQAAQASGEVHAMHDPTEGGLATGLWELAQASSVALQVQESEIQVIPEGRVLCEHFGLDPLACIASGALLLVVRSESAPQILSALGERGISAVAIGEVVEHGEPSVTLVSETGTRPMAIPERDAIAALFETS